MITITLLGYNLDFKLIAKGLSLDGYRSYSTKLRRLRHCSISWHINTETNDSTLFSLQHYLCYYLNDNYAHFVELKHKYKHLKIIVVLEYVNYFKTDGSQVYTLLDPKLLKLLSTLDISFGLKSTCKIVKNEEYAKFTPKVIMSKSQDKFDDNNANSHLFIELRDFSTRSLKQLCRRWIELNNKVGNANCYLCLMKEDFCLIFDIGIRYLYLIDIKSSYHTLTTNVSLFFAYKACSAFILNKKNYIDLLNKQMRTNSHEENYVFQNIIDKAKKSILTENTKRNNVSEN